MVLIQAGGEYGDDDLVRNRLAGGMTKASKTPTGSDVRRRQTLPVSRLLQKLLTPAARRHGFAETAVLADWPEIVGVDMAKRCQPLKITRQRGKNEPGTLVIQASPIMALELQHASPQIIDRINTYFGFRAIHRLRLIASGVRQPPPTRSKPQLPLSASQRDFIHETAAGIEAEPLRKALAALGAAVMTKVRS